MTHRFSGLLVAGILVVTVSGGAWAQPPNRRVNERALAAAALADGAALDAVTGTASENRELAPDADTVRRAFDRLLERCPPAFGQVLKLDPSLLANESYLAPYPAIAAFVAQHPEMLRNPTFYLEGVRLPRDPGQEDSVTNRRREAAQILAGMAAFGVFLVVTSLVVWIIRTMIENRRWARMSSTQYEVHSRLLERMSTNDELMAYIQTPAGRRFLESGPVPLPVDVSASVPIAAPLSRILWSVQVGTILMCGGAGCLVLAPKIHEDFAAFFTVVGGLALAIGIGFVISGGMAYGLSRQFGLLGTNHVDRS